MMDGLLSWASVMLVLNATCPDPRLVPDWQKMWRERLNHTHGNDYHNNQISTCTRERKEGKAYIVTLARMYKVSKYY